MKMNVTLKEIEGGVCAAKGFKAGGIHCGIRKNKSKKDLALILSEKPCSAAAVYTTNLVKGAPITVTKANIANGRAQAVICNSGNANTCNRNGVEIAEKMCALVEEHTGIPASDVVVASTGVIGQPLDTTPIASALPALKASLTAESKGSEAAAAAIMTTDTQLKEAACVFPVGDVDCRIGGIAKGSGMICPRLATMLVFLTSDIAIAPSLMEKALKEISDDTFNMISVDGDTSTNDTVAILANGLAGNKEITEEGEDYDAFLAGLRLVMTKLCRKIAADGEGATKLLECTVTGAKDKANAKKVAKSVISSTLTKAAMFGADANWGRILCAIGYAGAELDIRKVGVSLRSGAGEIQVCEGGAGVDFSEEKAKAILLEDEIEILVTLQDGDADAKAWGCDLTYEYVRINGDYRT